VEPWSPARQPVRDIYLLDLRPDGPHPEPVNQLRHGVIVALHLDFDGAVCAVAHVSRQAETNGLGLGVIAKAGALNLTPHHGVFADHPSIVSGLRPGRHGVEIRVSRELQIAPTHMF
jgi:hypothetical protein